MNVTLRQSVLILLAAQLIGNIAFAIYGTAQSQSPEFFFVGLVSSALYAALLFAYRKGWDYARHLTLLLIMAFVCFGRTNPQGADTLAAALLPPAIALVMFGPEWIIGSAVTVVTIRLILSAGQSVFANPAIFLIYVAVVGTMALARVVLQTAQRTAEANARQAEDARDHASEQAAQLAAANQEQEQQLDEQRRLLDLVATLEVPAVTLAEGVLFAPVVGHLDSRRAQALTARLLKQTYTQRARLVILDIAGVAAVDTLVATALFQTAQALQLLGCQVTISGISAEVAATLTSQGVTLAGVRTVRSPQEALAQHAGTLALMR